MSTTTFYKLEINSKPENIEKINKVLGIYSNSNYSWVYEIEESDEPVFKTKTVFSHFLDILEPNMDLLKDFISNDCGGIVFWLIYQYTDQCNLEFPHEDLSRIGKLKASLAISTYQYDKDQDNWRIETESD